MLKKTIRLGKNIAHPEKLTDMSLTQITSEVKQNCREFIYLFIHVDRKFSYDHLFSISVTRYLTNIFFDDLSTTKYS
jgi:hypothetical protein